MPANKHAHQRYSEKDADQAGPTDAQYLKSSSDLVPSTPEPIITCSEHTLTFPSTPVGKSHFKTVTINQQNANSPVTLRTNDPDNFQLASDSHPNFAPGLTLTPPTGGTHIHVRYLPVKSGRHVAELSIETAFSTHSLSLSGQSVNSLQALVTRQVNPLTPVHPATSRWVPLAALTVLAVLGVVFYAFRCQLAPGLCTEPAAKTSPALTRVAEPETPALAPAGQRDKATLGVATSRANRRKKRLQRPDTDASPQVARGAEQSVTSSVAGPSSPPPATDTSSSVAGNGGPRRSQSAARRSGNTRPENQVQRKPVPASAGTDESELERVLNGKPGNQ